MKRIHKAKKQRELKTQLRLKEQLTDDELKELMGIDRPTYRRGKGGAFRQRGGSR